MAHTFEELSGKTVAQLKEIAKGTEHDALRGYSTMHKEKLLKALCTALGIEGHEHHEVEGLDKGEVKAKLTKLKADREEALKAKDKKKLKAIRRHIRQLKRKIRLAIVNAPPVEEKAEEKPAEEKPAEEAPVAEAPAEEKPAEEQPPAEEKPAEEAPAAEAPAEEKPAEEQPPAEEKATEEKPAEEKVEEKPAKKPAKKAAKKEPSAEEGEGG